MERAKRNKHKLTWSAIRQIRRDEFEAGIVDLVCEVYYSIIATLYK